MVGSRRTSLLLALAAGCGRIGFDGAEPIGDGAAYADAVLASAPLAYFRLDETSGPARSLVGTFAGTYEGDFERGAPGAVDGNGCPVFDGVTSRIDLGDILPFTGNVAMTLEVWIRPTSRDGTRFVIDRGPDEGYAIYIGDSYALYERTSGGGEFAYVDAGEPRLNAWSYLVATYDGAVPRLYVDGELVAENLGSSGPIGQQATNLVLGDSSTSQFRRFEGCIDEVAFYGRALPTSEVVAHYAIARP